MNFDVSTNLMGLSTLGEKGGGQYSLSYSILDIRAICIQ